MKDEESQRIAAVDGFNMAEKKIKESTVKLNKADQDNKSAKAALEGAKR